MKLISGSLQEKNGKWHTVIYLKGADGKKRPKWERTGLKIKGNKKAAEKILRDRISNYEILEGYVNDSTLLSDFITLWLTEIKHRVDPNTYDGYYHYCENHIKPYFKKTGVSISSVKFEDVQAYLNSELSNGRLDGKGGLSVKTVREFKNILSSVFKLAQKKRVLRDNPCDLVELPTMTKKEPTFYTTRQTVTLLDNIKHENIYPIVFITLMYGLRRSELLGLKWDSVDWDNRLLKIKHTVVKYDNVYEKDKTKTQSSYRAYPITDEVMAVLRKAKADEMNNQKIFGSEYHKNDYVFKWPDGRPFSPDYVTARFRKLLKKYDLPHIRFHDLRHSCASILVNDGYEIKDISDWLGHASIQITADYYGHLVMERKNKIADAMKTSFTVSEGA